MRQWHFWYLVVENIREDTVGGDAWCGTWLWPGVQWCFSDGCRRRFIDGKSWFLLEPPEWCRERKWPCSVIPEGDLRGGCRCHLLFAHYPWCGLKFFLLVISIFYYLVESIGSPGEVDCSHRRECRKLLSRVERRQVGQVRPSSSTSSTLDPWKGKLLGRHLEQRLAFTSFLLESWVQALPIEGAHKYFMMIQWVSFSFFYDFNTCCNMSLLCYVK
jgi:hypothetical protein